MLHILNFNNFLNIGSILMKFVLKQPLDFRIYFIMNVHIFFIDRLHFNLAALVPYN